MLFAAKVSVFYGPAKSTGKYFSTITTTLLCTNPGQRQSTAKSHKNYCHF